MRNIALRRAIALVLALVMMLAMAACAPQNSVEIDDAYEGDTILAPGTPFKIVISSHSSWPYKEDHKIWQYFREKVGGDIEVNAIPSTEYATKVNLMMATPDELPDLLAANDPTTVINHAGSGAYVAIDENMDKLPNYKKFLDSMDPDVRANLTALRTYADGHNYWPLVAGAETVMNFATWMYRKDIFEKHGLEIPETIDDLYTVCKKLKELYPESYPLCFRGALNKMGTIGPSFAPDFSIFNYYDYDANEWKFGAFTETGKEIVLYMKKFMDEGLVPPDCFTIATSSWEELMSTDRGFITAEPIVRISYFNIPNQKINPDYEWAAFEPPAHDENAPHKIAKSNVDPSGYVIPNTKDQKRINNAFRVLDWMYTEEAIELLSWGKEGETYYVDENGDKKFIIEGDTTAQIKYGVSNSGLYQVIRQAAFEQVAAANSTVDPIWLTWIEEDAQPSWFINFSEEESAIINQYDAAVRSHLEEGIIKFVTGTKPMSEWDAFVQTAYDLGLETLLGAYDSAWKRMRGVK